MLGALVVVDFDIDSIDRINKTLDIFEDVLKVFGERQPHLHASLAGCRCRINKKLTRQLSARVSLKDDTTVKIPFSVTCLVGYLSIHPNWFQLTLSFVAHFLSR